jgi:hypothetical protein
VDMNSLLSGLANSQNNGCCSTKKCGCGGNNNSIIWIIILLCICGCGQGKGHGSNCFYGCKKKHCKKYCKCSCCDSCGCDSGHDGGFGGLGSGFGGFGGLGSGGFGCWWIIILILLCTCGKQNRGCSNNIINLDNCDEE